MRQIGKQFLKNKRVYMVRHGQSIWNHDSKFTGWTDIPLTRKGEHDALNMAKTLIGRNIIPTVLFSSELERAITTTNIIKMEVEKTIQFTIPNHTSWRLNEKHYGTLEGVPRQYIRDEYGDRFTSMMRNNFYMKPPVLNNCPRDDTKFPIYENCYYETMKNGESKENVLERLLPYFENDILYTLKKGQIPLIVTHKHCARVLMKHYLNMSDVDFENYDIPSKSILELEFNDKRELIKHGSFRYEEQSKMK